MLQRRIDQLAYIGLVKLTANGETRTQKLVLLK